MSEEIIYVIRFFKRWIIYLMQLKDKIIYFLIEKLDKNNTLTGSAYITQGNICSKPNNNATQQ